MKRHLSPCTQVPDAVPGGRAGVSLLPVLREDQEAVGPGSAAGEKKTEDIIGWVLKWVFYVIRKT